MKIYVINLLRSIDRLVAISRQFARLDLSFERVEAIDGKKLEPVNLTKDALDSYKCATQSELACNLSHAKALNLIAHGEDEYGVILEDDAVLSSYCTSFLKDSSWVPKGISVIKLDVSIKTNWIYSPQTINETHKLYERLTSDYLAAGYLISKEAALVLKQKIYETNILVDVLLYNYNIGCATYFKPYQLYPALIRQEVDGVRYIIHPKRSLGIKNRILCLGKYFKLNRWLQPECYKWGRVPFLK